MSEKARISIAIDGPAGAGKSTIAKLISKTLNILYLDTGAMYRTVALKAIREGVDTSNREQMSKLVEDIDIKVVYSDDIQHIFLDGKDVTELIRTPEVSIGASNVATVPAVRLKMVELQREVAKQNSVVMDGRDIGTYVLPDATLKFFLTASIEARAIRRYNELLSKGMTQMTLEDVKKDIEYRDKNDSSRDFAPLSKAQDAIEIDTTDLTIEQVVNKIMEYVKEYVY
ncbi:(d)CMP kinase [Acetivibrio straminisolvens]|jgi:cytidylate kinase|uniref:Cytidylate kinase n=1 Tax=Acetivibrio straminisolvens JCM 21531 TaxID=1294263 RepID=W4V6K5_9FIRM|nr:(d)CMP kinase [Acetivibrio straminisolvens]GAE89035.1 cytidylate kinase [Acetivibrio straminisolvens JCM 21531]